MHLAQEEIAPKRRFSPVMVAVKLSHEIQER
jgi:hypothetical protein